MEIWKTMKTTLELPDELMREVKIRAIHERKKLKDAIADFIRKGMAAGKPRRAKTPKPVKLRGGFVPTAEDIEAAIDWGRQYVIAPLYVDRTAPAAMRSSSRR